MQQTPSEIVRNGHEVTPQTEGWSDFALPPGWMFTAIVTGAERTTWHGRYDEAIRDSRYDAVAMTRDPFLIALLNERARAVGARRWHIGVEDETDERQLMMRDFVTKAVKRTPRLGEFKKSIVKWNVWFGRFGQQLKYKWEPITVKKAAQNPETNPTELDHFTATNPQVPAGPDIQPRITREMLVIRKWSPVNGDKIGHHFSGTPYILINSARQTEIPGAQITLTTLGMAIDLVGSWRQLFILTSYEAQDTDFFLQYDQFEAIHGVGERSTCYWLNYRRLEMESWYDTFFERVGLGTNVWLFDGANPNALDEAKKASQEHSQKNNIFVPVFQDSNGRLKGAFERIEVPVAGATLLREGIEHIEKQLERQIVGQAGSARTEPGGFGGHNDEFEQNTKKDIAKLDAETLDDFLTQDWIKVIVRESFPEWPDLWSCLSHVTDLEEVNPDKKLEAIAKAAGLGVEFVENDVRALTGMKDPASGDKIVGGKATIGAAGEQPREGGKFGKKPIKPNGEAEPEEREPAQDAEPQQFARQSFYHCPLCGGYAVPMATGGYRCSMSPCEWSTSDQAIHLGRWLTLGGKPGPTGEHEGGFHVYVDDAGVIQKGGPPEIQGKPVGEAHAALKAVEDEKQRIAASNQSKGGEPEKGSAAWHVKETLEDFKRIVDKFGGQVPMDAMRSEMAKRGVRDRIAQDHLINTLRREGILTGGSDEGRYGRTPEFEESAIIDPGYEEGDRSAKIHWLSLKIHQT
jgi:hypothetical protein